MSTITASTKTEKYIRAFESLKPQLFGDKALREVALQDFIRMGIPDRRSEEYKYVNVEAALRDVQSFDQSAANITMPEIAVIPGAITVVIVNGKLQESLSVMTPLPAGLSITDLSSSSSQQLQGKYNGVADSAGDPFAALNTALANGGVCVTVAASAVINKPLHIVHVTSAQEASLVSPRNLIIAGEHSQVTIIESFVTAANSSRSFTNAVTEISAARSSNVTHYKIQDEGAAGHLLNTTAVEQAEASVFTTINFTLGGAFVRNNLTIALNGRHIETHLNGLYLPTGSEVVDNHTLVDHRMPDCNSNELYKGIIEGKASATFNGKIFVRRDAQKTNAFQSNKNILLSDDGTINTKPQLEIYADDVKCSHGTSTGKLDEDKIFYLRARGLSADSARKLLMHAFASEVVDQIKTDALREYVENRIAARFQ